MRHAAHGERQGHGWMHWELPVQQSLKEITLLASESQCSVALFDLFSAKIFAQRLNVGTWLQSAGFAAPAGVSSQGGLPRLVRQPGSRAPGVVQHRGARYSNV